MAKTNVPPIKLAVRSKNGIEIQSCNFSNKRNNKEKERNSEEGNINQSVESNIEKTEHFLDLKLSTESNQPFQQSQCGKYLAQIEKDTVKVFCSNSNRLLYTQEFKKVEFIQFTSKLSSKLIGQTYFNDSIHSTEYGNVRIWDIGTGEVLATIYQPQNIGEQCPLNQFSDEQIFATNVIKKCVSFYKNEDFALQTVEKTLPQPFLRFKGRSNSTALLKSISIAPTTPINKELIYYRFAVYYNSSSKGSPCQVETYSITIDLSEKNSEPKLSGPISSRSFFASDVEYHWSCDSSKLLIEACSDFNDKSANKVYMGSKQLYLLHSDRDFACSIALAKEGHLQSATFSTSNQQFIVCHGFPIKTTIFDSRNGEPIFEFGEYSRNTISFSPHGRFVLIGGFRNLPGELDFWDFNKKKKLGSCKDQGARPQTQSPDSRLFITAKMHPFRQVENCYTIQSYNGVVKTTQCYDKLFQVEFRPSLPEIYSDKPGFPRSYPKVDDVVKPIIHKNVSVKSNSSVPDNSTATLFKSANNSNTSFAISKKSSIYVPPSARKHLKTGDYIDKRVDNKASNIQQKITQPVNRLPTTTSTVAERKAEKNRQRKERRKAARRKRVEEENICEEKQLCEPNADDQTKISFENLTRQDCEKLEKKLTKRLRQIQQIRNKPKSEHLNSDQLAKLRDEQRVREQLEQLSLLNFD